MPPLEIFFPGDILPQEEALYCSPSTRALCSNQYRLHDLRFSSVLLKCTGILKSENKWPSFKN